MNKKNFFYRQQVQYSEQRSILEMAEETIVDLLVKMGMFGIFENPWSSSNILRIGPDSPNSLLVICTGGTGYTKDGYRITRSAADTTKVDCSVDKNGISTAPLIGNYATLSIFAVPKVAESDPRVDGFGNTVYFNQDDSYDFEVEKSAETAIPVIGPPVSLRDDALLLADILIANPAGIPTSQITAYGTGVGEIDESRTQHWYRSAQFAAQNMKISTLEPKENLGFSVLNNQKKVYGEGYLHCWGIVDSLLGSFFSNYNVASVNKVGPGVFDITLNVGHFTSTGDIVPTATLLGGPTANIIFATVTGVNTVRFEIVNSGTLVPTDQDFSFHIAGRMNL